MMRRALGQIEACCKLMSNQETVVQDITNTSGVGIRSGGPVTQLRLARVSPCNEAAVADMVREVECRLLGKKVSSPSTVGEAQVWAEAATFLFNRIQASPGE